MDMTDQEFADWLRSLPRERTQEEVQSAIMEHDREQGPYVPHEHRSYYGESRH